MGEKYTIIGEKGTIVREKNTIFPKIPEKIRSLTRILK